MTIVRFLVPDPHIRVGGQEEGVRRAKARIMEYLDTKSNRYTQSCQDVSGLLGTLYLLLSPPLVSGSP